MTEAERLKERKRLSWTVRLLTHRFGWYRSLVEKSSFVIRGELSELPVIEAATLARNYYVEIDDHVLHPDDRVYHTSGTTSGERRAVIWPAADHRRYLMHRTRVIGQWLQGLTGGVFVDLGTGHAAASGREIFDRLGVAASSVPFDAPIEQHVELLRLLQPRILFTMPMILDRLVAIAGVPTSVERVILLGDVATATWKSLMRGKLGLRADGILDLYGTIEIGAIAFECHSCGVFHFHRHICPEISGPASSANARGELLITSFARVGFPCVRLATGDRVEGLFRLSCRGEERWSTQAVLGRTSWLVKHGEWVDCGAIVDVVRRVMPGKRFEVVKDEYRLVVRVEGGSMSDALLGRELRRHLKDVAPAVVAMIRAGLVRDVEVEYVPTGSLAHAALGKVTVTARGGGA